MGTPSASRQELRQQLRNARNRIQPANQKIAAHHLARRLCRNNLLLRSQHIAFYLPQDGEIDPARLVERALKMNKSLYLPVIQGSLHRGMSMTFRQWKPGSRMRKNRFGIPEPVSGENRPAHLVDLVLMPLVGFDREGNRLGMGGGFYDRSFAFKHRHPQRKPRLIGLAHQCQQVESLPKQSWDVPLDGIATDHELILIP